MSEKKAPLGGGAGSGGLHSDSTAMVAPVLTEEQTLHLVESGMSLARYGDGEMKIIRGKNCVSQVYDPFLQAELLQILTAPPPGVLVGVPRLCGGPKDELWRRWVQVHFAKRMNPAARYGSAFISRPDSAPWCGTPEWYDRVRQLWAGRPVTLVANGVRSLTVDLLCRTGAGLVRFVQCPYRDAYARIEALEREVMKDPGDRVILCCGPTATCLAVRLAGRGVQAIDLGHIGMFWPEVR